MIDVGHSGGSYRVEVTSFASAAARVPDDAVLLSDENVFRAWGIHFPARPTLAVPAGEASKSLATFARVVGWLADSGASRTTTLVAMGGGVVGDLGGFAAAAYMRGIPLMQVPTTLLAMVDSSVGGKVGVDLPQGKNLVGAFHPPAAVHVPLDALQTLPDRECAAGMAEVWKTGFIADAGLVELLGGPPLSAGDARLREVVERCVRLKARVVQEDEFETTGLRAILNFGHTVGHALETVTAYGPLLHGEAVSVGMVAEAFLGERLGISPIGTGDRVEECLLDQGLPTRSDLLSDPEPLLEAMRRDKKAKSGRLAFSLLTGIGGCKLVEGVDEGIVRVTLSSL